MKFFENPSNCETINVAELVREIRNSPSTQKSFSREQEQEGRQRDEETVGKLKEATEVKKKQRTDDEHALQQKLRTKGMRGNNSQCSSEEET